MASDPTRIVNSLSAFWASDALGAAIDLDLFTAIGRRRLTGAEVARRCDARADRVSRLCDYLTSVGLLRKARGRYQAAPDAARFLDRHSPDAITGLADFFQAPAVASAFAHLADIVRGGQSPAAAPNVGHALWRTFAGRTLALRRHYARGLADELEQRGLVGDRILDIGAGASPLGIELLRRRPTARLTALDRAGVLVVAREHAREAGVSSRVRLVAGEAPTAALGRSHDLALVINVLDYIAAPARRRLLSAVHRALRPGGVLVVGAPLADPGRTSPQEAVAYDLLLLALGAGRPSTAVELRRQLRAARFSRVARPAGGALVLAWKATKA